MLTYAGGHAAGSGNLSHSELAVRGKLGRMQMVDNQIERDVGSVAAFAVGSDPGTGFYLRVGDFVQGVRLPGGKGLGVRFAHDFLIEFSSPSSAILR